MLRNSALPHMTSFFSPFWILLPFSLLDHSKFVSHVSKYRHQQKLAFSFPFSLQLFNFFHWKAHFQFFNTLGHCPWNLSPIQEPPTKALNSTREVTALALNGTGAQPLLELFILKLFTESCVSSPSYSIILEFCHQPVSCTSPRFFPVTVSQGKLASW